MPFYIFFPVDRTNNKKTITIKSEITHRQILNSFYLFSNDIWHDEQISPLPLIVYNLYSS